VPSGFLFDGAGLQINVAVMTTSRNTGFIPAGRVLLILLALATAVLIPRPALAESPDEEYLRIYDLMVDADGLKAAGKADLARAKYLEVQKELVKFRDANPSWNPKVISYRLNELAAKLAAPPAKTGTNISAATETSGESAPAPVVKVVTNGSEPRTQLRFHPKPGTKQSVTMSIEKAMTMTPDGGESRSVKSPTLEMDMDMEVTAVSPKGDISYTVEIADVRVSNESEDAKGGGAEDTALKGLKVNCVVSDLGELKSSEFTLPPDANPQVKQSFDQVKEFVTPMKLIEAAVGAGGKWEVGQDVSAQGLKTPQTEQYEVVSITGDEVVIKSGIDQRVTNQRVTNPQMPGVRQDINRMETTGEATVTLDLSKLMPIKEIMQAHTELDTTVSARDRKQSMKLKMDMKSKVETK
jgi:hypothetical protein